MRPVDGSKFKYRDKLASKRRQRVQVWTGLIVIAIVATVAAIGYGLFYTSWLRIQTVVIEGLSDEHKSEVQQIVDRALEHKFLGIPVGRNLLFFSTDRLVTNLSESAFLKQVNIYKKFFHTLHIIGLEREAEGIWCFQSDCRYFDHSGTTWGQTGQSSGFLLLNINDLRTASASATIDQQFLKATQLVVSTLVDQGIKTKQVIISAGSFTEFNVIVSENYPIKFSLDSDILGQLKTYQIFRDQKIKSTNFQPQYIDLRFDGRVYYK